MSHEAERLRELLAACHRVLPHLSGRSDQLAETIRATCTEIEERLAELGAVSDELGESRA
jgi:hypothetical protein